MIDPAATAHGLAAALGLGACLYLLGLVLIPPRLSSLAAGPLMVAGAAIYVVLSWIAVTARHVPLTLVLAACGVGLAVALSLQVRRVGPAIASLVGSPIARLSAGVFAAFYVFASLLIRLPGSDSLPLSWNGGPDLISHLRYARHVLAYGNPAIDAAIFEYGQAAAATHLLAANAVFFGGDVLHAAMPLELALVAALGAGIAACTRTAFGLQWPAAIGLGTLVVSSQPVAAVTGAFHLEALIGACAAVAAIFSLRTAREHGVAGTMLVLAATFSLWALSRPSIPLIAIIAIVVGAAALVELSRREDLLRKVAVQPGDRRLISALPLYVAGALVVANVSVHASRRDGYVHVPAAWQNVARLETSRLQAVTLRVDGDRGGLLAGMTRYFLPRAAVHVIDRGSNRDLPFESISAATPLVMHNFNCSGAGHTDVLPLDGVGCAIFAPPSLAADTLYPFNSTFLSIGVDRMGDRTADGRWSRRDRALMTLIVDPQRTDVNRPMYLNLEVEPSPRAEASQDRLVISWGSARTAEVTVPSRSWASIPVSAPDWTGNRLWTLPLAIDFPARRPVLFRQLSLSAAPRAAPAP